MTGRWSEVLMLEQLLYFNTLMSSACRLLNRIRSCQHTQRERERFNPADIWYSSLDFTKWFSSHCVWRRPLFGGGVVDIAADVELVRGEEVYRCLLETFKDGTWSTFTQWGSITHNNLKISAEVFTRELHTVLHLLGELVVLQQRSHVSAHCALHDGLHVRPLFTQPEVKISEPEDLVEPRGDVSYNKMTSSDYQRLLDIILTNIKALIWTKYVNNKTFYSILLSVAARKQRQN